MTSGMGVRGTMGRCYGFWMDFKACQQEFAEKMMTPEGQTGKVKGCFEEREDYFECLHGKKQFMRYQAVMEEMERQDKEKKNGGSGHGGGGGH